MLSGKKWFNEEMQKYRNINSLIIVYCDSGVRSKNAQKRLQKIGYKQVYNLCK